MPAADLDAAIAAARLRGKPPAATESQDDDDPIVGKCCQGINASDEGGEGGADAGSPARRRCRRNGGSGEGVPALMGNHASLSKGPTMNFVTEAQIQFGRRIGLDLAGKTVRVAQAMIEDAIHCQFYARNDLGEPTPKQIELARKFSHDTSTVSRRVGDAIIDDIMTQLNCEAIANQRLAPDVVVTNKHDQLGRKFVISSITEDGTVYFRGSNGAKAWARSLIRADD
jgi:hypothetical protein